MLPARSAMAAAALCVVATLAGCSAPHGCPEMGWVDTVEVRVSAADDNVQLVRLCLDAECAKSPPRADGDASGIGERIGIHGSELSPGRWTLLLNVNSATLADAVTVQALSADDEVLAEIAADLHFVRVDGSDDCGGPSRAEVALVIPG
jgi:hypothetical protein